jgi:hypothetical protein
MSSFAAMSVLVGVLALALLGYFAVMWTKDKGRSDEESADPSRLDADTRGGGAADPDTPRRRDGTEGV